jgi:hypothetical protein
MKTAAPMRADALNKELGSISGTPPTGVAAEANDTAPSNTSKTADNFLIWLALLMKFLQTSQDSCPSGIF